MFLEQIINVIEDLEAQIERHVKDFIIRYGHHGRARYFYISLIDASGPINIAFTKKHKGYTMNVTMKKGQFVVFTAVGANATNPNAPITAFGAASTDVGTDGNPVLSIVVSGNTATITSLEDGSASVAYTASDDNGLALPGFTDSFTIADVDTVATSFSGSYTAPADVVAAS